MAKRRRSSSVPASETGAFRSFNRMYTQYIGTLNEKLLGSGYSLAEARVLYELATRSSAKASDIASELAMDPGYLSRILGQFKRNGLIRAETSREDGRATVLRLTSGGRAAFQKLNALSDEQAQEVLESLAPAKRSELLRAMAMIEGVFAEAGASRLPYLLRPHRVGDMGWVVYREAVGYAEQFGWDEKFEALVATIVAGFIENFQPSRERCWIAEVDGQNVGHIFLVQHLSEPHTAKLRLLFVEPCARGIGLGDVLVTECVRFARSAGYRKVVLWTQSTLMAAHRIYQRAGFRLVKEEPHHSFGHDLIGQEWELVFSGTN